MAKKSKKSKREKAEQAAAKKSKQRAEKRGIRKQRAKDKANEWQKDFDKFCDQLKPFGLTIKDVKGDGNCLFRAVADQVEGKQASFAEYRRRCCDFMMENPDSFKPFVFDEDYTDYIKRMRKDGEWGGNLELAGISQTFSVHITIHQLAQPRWEVKNPNNAFSRTIHLSYHDGQHYCSVRNLSDNGRDEASEIKAFDHLTSNGTVEKRKNGESKEGKTLRILRESTGCKNSKFMGEALADNMGDIDATIEYLISMREAQLKEFYQEDGEEDANSDNNSRENTKIRKPTNRKVNRNGPCPCGSKKKYKVCCAKADKEAKAEARRKKSRTPSPSRKKGGRGVRIQNLTNKQRKELAKQAKREKNRDQEKSKGKSKKEAKGDDAELPVDLGSLCI